MVPLAEPVLSINVREWSSAEPGNVNGLETSRILGNGSPIENKPTLK